VWWCTPVIPATQEVKTEGSKLEASLGQVSTRPYLKNKLKAKGLGVWLKWQMPDQQTQGLEFNYRYHQKNNNRKLQTIKTKTNQTNKQIMQRTVVSQ
jgi:outer membrane receptor for ferrienterochelin and colicin